MAEAVTEQNHYPWVKFTLHGESYCISSRYVSSMSPVGGIAALPDQEPWLLGIIRMAGDVLPIVDLRTLLHLPNLQTDLDAFAEMKHKHVSWVEELERSVREGGPFEGNRDPHRCSFGVWYDGYHSSNNMIDFILDSIGEPHERLHRCAARLDAARASGQEQEVENILAEAKTLCEETMVPLLDQLIEAYNEAHKGMVLTLSGGEDEGNRIGVVVDSVTGLESFTERKGIGTAAKLGASGYLRDILIGADHRIYLEVDAERLLQITCAATEA